LYFSHLEHGLLLLVLHKFNTWLSAAAGVVVPITVVEAVRRSLKPQLVFPLQQELHMR